MFKSYNAQVKKTKHRIILSTLSFLVLFLGTYLIDLSDKNNNYLYVYFLDVGQGDAILIDAPNGNQILIDAGRDEKVLKELDSVMNFYDKSINAIVMSHADLDHIGGFFDVIENYSIKKVYRPDVPIDSDEEETLINYSEDLFFEIKDLSIGDKIIIDSENKIYMETLWPFGIEEGEDFERNENSLVFRLVYGDSEFILTGDSTTFSEEEILKRFGDEIFADVLKVGHHGSNTSTSEEFLEKIKAKFAIISAGKNNSYGHPTSEVLEKLNKFGMEILETSKEGTIIFRTDGEDLEKVKKI